MEAKHKFGANLRSLRTAAGLSQQELGDRASLHMTEISRLERGLRDPRLETVARLATALGLPAGALVEGIGAG